MLRHYPSEEFREISVPTTLSTYKYAVSNYGRIARYTESFADAQLMNPRIQFGYNFMIYRTEVDGKRRNRSKALYKLVAEAFLEKDSPDQENVIHLDHDRGNDHVSNLKWVTKAEMIAHQQTSPRVIAAKANRPNLIINNGDGHKLTSTQVIRLKKRLFDPNRKTRIKILAKEFGISEMQVHRIKSGENWGHIKI